MACCANGCCNSECCGEEDICCDEGEFCCGGSCCATECRNGECCEFVSLEVTALRDGPPAQTDITVQSAEYGVTRIDIEVASNCTVNVPSFGRGTTAPLVCTATKINPSLPARASLLAVVAGREGRNTLGEAIVTQLRLNTGGWVKQTFDAVPRPQGLITVQNGSPGIGKLEVLVNSTTYQLTLLDNEVATIDATADMRAKDSSNTIILKGYGVLGADAVVVIGQKGQAPIPLADGWQNSTARENWVWGNLTNEIEKMSKRCVASSASQTVQVAFDGLLDTQSASDPYHYSVDVNGTTVGLAMASYDANANIVTLTLPAGTLQAGNAVVAYWDDLLSADQRQLYGCTQPMTAQ